MRVTFRTVLHAVLLMVILAQTMTAGSGGSTYSLLGIGDLRYSSGIRSAGMGYTGIGLPSPGYINSMSPATWARIDRTRLEAGLLYEGFNSSDGTTSRYLARADFNGALLALPLSPSRGLTFVGGFVPFSSINYNTYTSGTHAGADGPFPYSLQHIGTGGLGKGIVGLSFAPSPELAVGFSLNYLFGSFERQLIQSSPASDVVGAKTTERTTANGVSYTLGGLFTGLGSLTPALRSLSLGFFVQSRGVLSTERKTISEYAALLDTSAEVTNTLAVPLSYGVGVSYLAAERLMLAADYVTDRWATAEIDGHRPAGTGNAYRVGVGLERLPSRELSAGFFQRAPLRLGFSYHWTYYRAGGSRISEWVVTAGTALPLAGETRLNIAGEYGVRGSLDSGGIRDRIFRLNFSISISETWFVPFEED